MTLFEKIVHIAVDQFGWPEGWARSISAPSLIQACAMEAFRRQWNPDDEDTRAIHTALCRVDASSFDHKEEL